MLHKFLTSAFTLLVLVSCITTPEKERIPIKAPYFSMHVGLYFLDNNTDKNLIEKSLKSLGNFTKIDSLPDSISSNLVSLDWFDKVVEYYPAPTSDYLSHSARGLTEQQILDLQNPVSAAALGFIGPSENVGETQKRISEFIQSISESTSCIILDYSTYEAFNAKSWQTLRVDNLQEVQKNIPSQITIHTYRDTEYCRAVTLGMEKFGLPDLSIQNISCKNQVSVCSMMNAVVQLWHEQDSIYTDSTMFIDLKSIKNKIASQYLTSDLLEGAKLKATINLRDVVPQEGDADNKQFEIIFEDEKYDFVQQEHDDLIAALFGAEDDISYISHDEELLRLSEAAKVALEALRVEFNDGLKPGSSLLVKSPFETSDGGNEWMWIEITRWNGNQIQGILQNEPFHIPDLKSGAIVDVDQSEIFDYIYYKDDGTTEGNKTGELILQMQK